MDGILSSIETDGTSTQTQFVQPSVFSSSNSSVMTENSVNGMNGMISNGGSPIKPTRLAPLFEMIDTQQIIIAPKNNLQKANTAYSKTTQTEDERVSVGEFSMGSQEFDYDEFSVGEKVDINFDESPHHELAKFLPNLRLGIRETQDENEPPQEERIPELSEDEKRQILQSEDFSSFFLKAGRVMIRELAEIVSFFYEHEYKKIFRMKQQLIMDLIIPSMKNNIMVNLSRCNVNSLTKIFLIVPLEL